MDWQQTLGINHEQTINEWALHFKPLVIAANYFYGSLHFIVTIGVGIYLFRKWPNDYPRWRNTLGIATAARAHRLPLLPAHAAPPARHDADAHYGFVDTLAKYPTLWSFNSGAMKKISNQFAAMPSVHCCLGAVVRVRARAPAEAHVGEGARRALPGDDRRGDRASPPTTTSSTRSAASPCSASATCVARLVTRAGRGPAIEHAPAPADGEARDRPRPRRDRDGRHRGRARHARRRARRHGLLRRRRLRLPLGAGAPRRRTATG